MDFEVGLYNAINVTGIHLHLQGNSSNGLFGTLLVHVLCGCNMLLLRERLAPADLVHTEIRLLIIQVMITRVDGLLSICVYLQVVLSSWLSPTPPKALSHQVATNHWFRKGIKPPRTL